MNFFKAQDKARGSTRRLIWLFCLAVLALIFVCYVIARVALGLCFDRGLCQIDQGFASGLAGSGIGQGGFTSLFDFPLLLGTALIVLSVVLVGTINKVLTLRGGGRVVAESLNGTVLSPDTQDRVHRRALNVVEEIAIASGTPVPQVYLIPEPGINAFAAGYSPSDAVIGLTEGTLANLDRGELQGVVAHEFSHILNGDMRLNIRIMGVLHGILLISLIGRVLMYTRGKNAAPIIGLGLFLAGWVGFFFGGLIKSGISRQREYLADASAVQFTRDTNGIAGALQKIGGSSAQLAHPSAEQISHSLFADGAVQSFWSFATHPPLKERIRRIDPQWDGAFTSFTTKTATEPEHGDVETQGGSQGVSASAVLVPAVAALHALDSAGQADSVRLNQAQDIIARLSKRVLDGIREPFSARAIVYALVITQSDSEWHEAQLALVKEKAEEGVYDLTIGYLELVSILEANDRLPLVELAIPALRMLSKAQFVRFRENLSALIKIDDSVSVFEWALHKVLVHHLDCAFVWPAVKISGDRTLLQVEKSCYTVFTVLADAGNVDIDADKAFNAAVVEAGLAARPEPTSRPTVPNIQNGLDEAFKNLQSLKVTEKEQLLKACVTCITHDGQVTVSEMELLRAFADVLGCPIPPTVIPSC